MNNHLRFKDVLRLGAVLTFLTLLSTGQATPAAGALGRMAATPASNSADAPALLSLTAGGHVLGFAPDAAWFATGSHALRVGFEGATAVTPQAAVRSPQGAGQSGGETLGRVTYTNLWPGIALTYEAVDGAIAKSTYHVAPGADPAQIRLRYNAPVALQDDGSLSLTFHNGRMTESAPVAWQNVRGQRMPVDVVFVVFPSLVGKEAEIGFRLGDYDARYPLIIDPNYQWHTFYGAGGADIGYGIAADGSGNVYVVGQSAATWTGPNSADIPLHAHSGSDDITVLKLTSAGAYLWHTFYGSYSGDSGYGIAVAGGNVYVAGQSFFSWTGPSPSDTPRHAHSGNDDIVVLKLDSAGTYQWHTFYGSDDWDYSRGIVADGSGGVYTVGYSSLTWNGPNLLDTPLHAHTGGYDITVLKLTSAGGYLWHTFYGSSDADYGWAVAVGSSDDVYVAGTSRNSWNGPNPTDTPLHSHSGNNEITALKLTSAGAYRWHTFYGSSIGNDYAHGVAVAGGNVYVAGYSVATWNGPNPADTPLHTHSGEQDITVLKLTSDGAYQWHTFYGNSDWDFCEAITADGGGVYVTGYSDTTWNGPDPADTPLHAHSGFYDSAVLKLDSTGAYQWHSFYGSTFSVDEGYGIVASGVGNVITAGRSNANWNGDGSTLPLHAHSGGDDIAVLSLAQTPLAVALASFAAQAMVDHILLSWETVSEVDNAGFNLYRSASPAAPDEMLAFVPSQAPGSTVGASYTFADDQVAPGQTWYYWLEDVDLNGATSLHGPVSATLQAPTAVTVAALEAQAASPGSVTTWGALVAALIAAAGAIGVRRRTNARQT